MDTIENNQSQTGFYSCFPIPGWVEQLSESLRITPQEGRLRHRDIGPPAIKMLCWPRKSAELWQGHPKAAQIRREAVMGICDITCITCD